MWLLIDVPPNQMQEETTNKYVGRGQQRTSLVIGQIMKMKWLDRNAMKLGLTYMLHRRAAQ
jgi:hypothetical protein